MVKIHIIEGGKFGLLETIEEAQPKYYSGRKYRMVLCRCQCGNYKNILLNNLRRGLIKSCGCLNKEFIGNLNKTHSLSKTRFYRIFKNMKNRCDYLNYPEFKYRGGRGIECDWKTFEDFRDDMYESYLKHCDSFGEKQTTIDRIDVDGNYCKKNCCWATYKEQSKNKRATNGYDLNGVHRSIRKISQYDLQGNFIKDWDSITNAATSLNLNSSLISAVCVGRRNKTGNFVFKYFK